MERLSFNYEFNEGEEGLKETRYVTDSFEENEVDLTLEIVLEKFKEFLVACRFIADIEDGDLVFIRDSEKPLKVDSDWSDGYEVGYEDGKIGWEADAIDDHSTQTPTEYSKGFVDGMDFAIKHKLT